MGTVVHALKMASWNVCMRLELESEYPPEQVFCSWNGENLWQLMGLRCWRPCVCTYTVCAYLLETYFQKCNTCICWILQSFVRTTCSASACIYVSPSCQRCWQLDTPLSVLACFLPVIKLYILVITWVQGMLWIYKHKTQGPVCLWMQQHPECPCHNSHSVHVIALQLSISQ